MACVSRTPGRPMTANQLAQLMALHGVGAVSKETGVPADKLPQSWNTASPMIIGALRDKGLAASRSRRVAGRSWTEYWLTDEGVAAAIAQGVG